MSAGRRGPHADGDGNGVPPNGASAALLDAAPFVPGARGVFVASELRVGRLRRPLTGGALAALALVALAVVAFYVRGRYGWLFVRGPEYESAFADVAGLAEGAEVRYAGLGVGKVRRVEIDPADARRVLVTLRVREGTPVRASTHATVVAAGAAVASYVNLRPGAPDAPRLAAGARVASEQGPTVEDVMRRVTVLLDRTDTLLLAAAPLADGRVFAGLARTVARVDTLVTAASSTAGRWAPQLERAARRADDVLARTDGVVAALDSARPALARAPGELTAVLDQSRALLTDVRAGVDEGGGLQQLMRDLTTAGENIARVSERLERDPLSALQHRRNPPKSAGPALR